MTSTAFVSAQRTTVSTIGRLTLADARVYGVLVTACAMDRTVTLRRLAQIPGSNGHPVGLRGALDIVRDLSDTALVHVNGLSLTTPDSPRSPHVPGCVGQGTRLVPAPAAVPEPVAPRPAKSREYIHHVGQLGRLPIPAVLPDGLRNRLVVLAAEFRNKAVDTATTAEMLELQSRKVGVLTEWAGLPDHSTPPVRAALAQALEAEQRARRAHEAWGIEQAEMGEALQKAAATTRPRTCDESESVGMFKSGLPIPAGLPEDLKAELLAIAAAYEGGGQSADRQEKLRLGQRRVAALTRWATHPLATKRVIREVARAQAGVENLRACN